jgi:hypothetical protein
MWASDLTESWRADRHRLHIAVNAIAETPGIPPGRIPSIHNMIDAGENEVALEILCSNVYEFSIPVPESARTVIWEIGRSIGLGQEYVDMLAESN